MGSFLRRHVPGGTFFFTVVTYRRRRILTSQIARQCLRRAIDKERSRRPFEILAIVLLPEHFHTVWTLPADDDDYSTRMQKIKEGFSKEFLAAGGTEGAISDSLRRRRRRGLWQPQFWEHTVRNEIDLKRCVDYLHWNPVKHSLVPRVVDYPWSSFHRFVRMGEYPMDWGGENPCPGVEMAE